MPEASTRRAGAAAKRRHEILTVLLEQPTGLTFVEILAELPLLTALKRATVRRDLLHLEDAGHVLVSDEARWYTSRLRVARFNDRGQQS